MKKAVLLWLILSFPVLAADSSTVLMITFRGITAAERGFMNHFRKKDLPVRFVLRDCNNDKARLPAFISEIPGLKPDLIYAFGTTVAVGLAGAPAAGDIPLVCNIIADPAGAGLVKTGRDLTGVCHLVPVAVQVRAIRSMLPFRTLGVIYNPLEKNSVLMVEQLEKCRDSCSFKVIKIAAAPPADPAPAVERLKAAGAELLYLPSDSYIISRAGGIAARAAALKLPVFSATEEPILKSGALFGVVSRYYNAGQFAGHKAEQILFHGMKARDIPFETLSRFSFIINMKTARQIGFIPPILTLKFAEVVTE